LGLRVGRDYGLAGCEDNSELWHAMNVVSRMGFDRGAMGRHAAGMMLNLLDKPDAPPPSVELRDEWIAGETTPGPG
jgi:DNA-binding LacI/PurR family transcriptional regulator